MKYNLVWSGLADQSYYNAIAKYCLPSWEKLPGDKFIVSDFSEINLPFIKLQQWDNVINRKAKFLTMTQNFKTLNFWRKMQSQVYAIRNFKKYDFLILLDTDIEILDFDTQGFEKELDNLIDSNLVWATGESNRRGHDSGFIVLNMNHPNLQELTNHYENVWESGEIFKLKKSYDGNVVENMFTKYPSYKIKNRDYGKGLHVYELGLVHYGSKLPKQLRAEWQGGGKDLVAKRISEITVKTYKSEINSNNPLSV
jgi:hypothetical protein